jgi:7-cyano-7-deazaguanine synthase
MHKQAVILFSGGLDSTTTLAIAKSQGYRLLALSFDYGQRHRVELDCARRVAERIGVVEHRIVRIDLQQFGGSALTADIPVPKNRSAGEIATGIPITYVPARNTLFLSWGLAFAEARTAWDLFIGVNALDYSGYPDCRPEYINAFERMANLAAKAAVEGQGQFKIHTPLIHCTKAQIIRAGLDLGVDYSQTHSCYDPAGDGSPCGQCDSCHLRLKGFREAGAADPLRYPQPNI